MHFKQRIDFGDTVEYSINIGYEDYQLVPEMKKVGTIKLDKDISKRFELKNEQIFRNWSIVVEKMKIPYSGIYEIVLVGGGGRRI